MIFLVIYFQRWTSGLSGFRVSQRRGLRARIVAESRRHRRSRGGPAVVTHCGEEGASAAESSSLCRRPCRDRDHRGMETTPPRFPPPPVTRPSHRCGARIRHPIGGRAGASALVSVPNSHAPPGPPRYYRSAGPNPATDANDGWLTGSRRPSRLPERLETAKSRQSSRPVFYAHHRTVADPAG